MTKDEALKLALEALEYLQGIVDTERGPKAITAIKQALNDATHLAAPVQEPVAWIVEDQYGERLEWAADADVGWGNKTQPLYTTPPASQRQWVGLTDEDVYPLANEHLHYQMEGYEVSGIYNLARAIEAKLKEKNT